MVEMTTIKVSAAKCDRCGYTWIAKVANPVSCPRCKQYLNKKRMPVKEGC